MARTLVINVAGLGRDLVADIPTLADLAERGTALPLEPVLPAVTCTMQATLTTGEPPARHGIVGNGLYFFDTAEVRFWEQSAHLVGVPRVWDHGPPVGPAASSASPAPHSALPTPHSAPPAPHAALRTPHSKVASLFWQLSMYGTADVVLTPKPVHGPGGELIEDCYSRPGDLYARLAAGESALEPGRARGPFPLRHYWGPLAGLPSTRWIADATLQVWRDRRPDLLLTYLPHLDYSGHRAGPGSEAHRAAARDLEPLLSALVGAAEADGARVVVLSEYSFLPVRRAVAPNRALREAGLLAVREIAGAEYFYPGDARAFALADNQAAHVYFPATQDPSADARRARHVLERLDGVAAVLDREALRPLGLDHVRSGDLLLLAEPDAHFTYYWWLDDAKAPPFARTVDIHAKPGFDAAELLVDPATRAIPLSAEGVRGSHGLVLEDGRGWGMFLCSDRPATLRGRTALRAVEAAALLVG